MNETEILQYAIKGYAQQQEAIEERIRELRAELKPHLSVTFYVKPPKAEAPEPDHANDATRLATTPKRQFSAVTRKRMARAQRLRWQKRSA